MICTAAGAAFSSVLKKRCEQLKSIHALLDEMSVKIRYRSVRMTELLSETLAEPAYSRCTFAVRLSESIHGGMQVKDAWRNAADTAVFLAESDRELLRSIGERLGESDTEGQLSMLSLGMSMLSRAFEEADDERIQKSRTIFSVWALCGIGAGIIII